MVLEASRAYQEKEDFLAKSKEPSSVASKGLMGAKRKAPEMESHPDLFWFSGVKFGAAIYDEIHTMGSVMSYKFDGLRPCEDDDEMDDDEMANQTSSIQVCLQAILYFLS